MIAQRFKNGSAAVLLCVAALTYGPAMAQANREAWATASGKTIARVWHGKTLRAKADSYEQYLAAAIRKFPSINGNLGYQLMRLDGGPDGDEYVEFQVVSYWDTLESIKAYAGQDLVRTRDLPVDKDFLVNQEQYVRNYRLITNIEGKVSNP